VPFSDIPNWPDMKARYLNFWNRCPVDRPLLHVQVTPTEPAPTPPPPGDRWLEPEVAMQQQEQFQTTWTFLAELFPKCLPPIGPNALGAYLGGRPRHDGTTMWLEPVLDDWADADRLRFDPANRYWQATLEHIDYLTEHYGGRVMLVHGDLGGTFDVAAALRGTERICFDVVDHPAQVRNLCDRIAEAWKQCFDIQHELLTPHADGGSCVWLPLWGPGRVGIIADDLGVLLSAKTYGELVLPSVRTMLAHVDLSVYHFHAAARHLLDVLLDVPDLHAIQYGIDPNTPPILECIDDLVRIQRAGKGLFLGILEPEEVGPIADALDSAGLVLLVQCDTTDSAEAVIGSFS